MIFFNVLKLLPQFLRYKIDSLFLNECHMFAEVDECLVLLLRFVLFYNYDKLINSLYSDKSGEDC